MERQLPAVLRGFAVLFGGEVGTFWGTEAPSAHGLFCWKLVRINSLACPPLCPAEVDKHKRSRSDTSPRGTKRKAAQSASLCREARVKLLLHVPSRPTPIQKKAHDQMNLCRKKPILCPCLPDFTL